MNTLTLCEKLLTRGESNLVDGWKASKLGKISKIARGKFSHRPRNDPRFFGGSTPFIQTGDIVAGNGYINKHSQTLNEQGLKVSKVFPAGTIMMAIAANIGDCAINLYDCACTDSVVGITPSTAHSNKYLNFYLNNRKDVFRYIAPEGAQKNINVEFLESLPIVTPPLPEQRKIAEILGTWDRAIETQQQLINSLTRRKKALMQQLLTGKTRLPGFEGAWKLIKIGDLFEEIKRPVNWNEGNLYDLVSVRRRSGGFFFRTPLYGREIKTKKMFITRNGDFVISKMQVVHGAMAMTPPKFHEGHVSGSYITLIPKDPSIFHVPFFDWLSRTRRLYHLALISSHGVIIEKMTFVLKDFYNNSISIPPNIEEQQAITNILATCDDELALHTQHLDSLRQQKRGLMQQLLTGKIRVITYE